MGLLVRVKPRAERQIDAAAAWWSENRLAAPGAIRADLKAALEALVEQPGIGTLVENARDPETRRLYLARTSYFVYYRPRGKYLEARSARSRSPPPGATASCPMFRPSRNRACPATKSSPGSA